MEEQQLYSGQQPLYQVWQNYEEKYPDEIEILIPIEESDNEEEQEEEGITLEEIDLDYDSDEDEEDDEREDCRYCSGCYYCEDTMEYDGQNEIK
jgi:hypothetical protein